MRVRPGRPQDWASLVGHPPERWREAPGGGDVKVAEVGDRPAGFSVATGNEVDAIYTHPSVWGGGAGRALLAETLATIAAGDHEELRHKLAL